MSPHFTQNDIDLLALLQADARLSNSELSDRVAMSASSCWRRIKSLEDSGIIDRYAAILDPAKMGLQFDAIVHVQLARHDSDGVQQFLDMVRLRPEIVECTATTGNADYHLRVVCKDVAAYNDFLENVLFKLTCLRSAQTNMVLKRIKSHGVLRPHSGGA